MDQSTERRAVDGELCTCGRQAIFVFVSHGPEHMGRETGYCGVSDGGARGPCVFCGSTERHVGRCPQYRLRLTDPVGGD